jgi:hypothetical protein
VPVTTPCLFSFEFRRGATDESSGESGFARRSSKPRLRVIKRVSKALLVASGISTRKTVPGRTELEQSVSRGIPGLLHRFKRSCPPCDHTSIGRAHAGYSGALLRPLSPGSPRWNQEASELDKKSLVAKIDLRLVGDAEEFR